MNSLPDVPLATNTSALSVAAVAEATHHRERVLGLHFFNPAPVMPLVEVVATPDTARAVVEAAVAFAEGLGKTPVVCGDSPGFIVNRVNRGFSLEPLRMLEAGVADVPTIDAAIEAAGYPMGPFRLMDLVGIDVNLAVATSLFEAFDDAARFRPSAVQAAMVQAGRLGRKTRLGFYRYSAEGASSTAEPPAGLPRTAAGPAAGLDPGAIVERVNLAIVNEAYRAVEERVAAPGDIDLAMKLGASHPMGPFERAGKMGLRSVVEGLRRLQAEASETSGDQYEIAPLLWQMAIV
jgi:3-hydroxybutyryl-CoA dehydrogenase